MSPYMSPRVRMRHREFGVDLNGALEKGQRRRQRRLQARTFTARAVGFQGFERRRGRLGERSVECFSTVASDSPTRVRNLLAI